MESPLPSLDGKVILVTGAAKRVGRAIALRLAREGARVAIHYSSSRAEAEQTAADCNGAELFRADLTKVPAIEAMFADIDRRLGRLDGLVNNAARFTKFNPLDVTEADWDFIHDVNLKATFFCCREAGRRMKAQGYGRIVNISSLGGLRPWADHAHYCASKAGVIMLTKALAKSFAPEITVNSVAPGVIPFGEWNDEMAGMVRATPAARVGTGDEIADAVAYFLSASNYVTGQIMAVDGGLSLR
ncbi:MAG: SDR family NAD(P)-dependent oxidoreductase [Acidobacteria bacterium]|nr:SDR family NAD(P)-dependent oxidoreductase [Acidobacteriota bacterium]